MPNKSVLVALMIACIALALANDIFDISFTRADLIDHNKTLCKNHYCYVKRFRNNSNLLSIGCEVIYTPIVFVRATVYYKFGLIYKPFLINITRNLCEVLTNGYKAGADINMFLEPIKKYSNVIHPCPFEGNYSMVNLPATAIKLPPLVPAGDYRLDFRIFNRRNQTLAFPRIYFIIKAKGKYVLAMG